MTADPRTPQLVAHGATYVPAQVAPGQQYWRLVRAEGPLEYGGRASIYVDVQGLAGQRLVGVRVRLWNGGNSHKATEPKPGEEFGLDFPIFAAGNAYGVQVADGPPSDAIYGMGLIPFKDHVSYKLVFRLSVRDGGDDGGEAEPPDAAREAIDEAIRLLEKAKGLL